MREGRLRGSEAKKVPWGGGGGLVMAHRRQDVRVPASKSALVGTHILVERANQQMQLVQTSLSEASSSSFL